MNTDTERDGRSRFEIRTFEGPSGSAVSVSPERGGIITSIRLSGKEILFMNPETFRDPSKNVRGGIPILFPFSGPATDGIRKRFPGLDRQHGFARNADRWSLEELPEGGFRETFESDDETKRMFPFEFRLSVEVRFGADGAVTIVESVTNDGTEPMPVSPGLHPYFRVDHGRRADIAFDFEGGDRVKGEYGIWTNSGTTVIDNPGTLRVRMPGRGTIAMEVSPEYRKILVWSAGPDADYLCIEPVLRGDGGLVDEPRMIAPGESFSIPVTYRLETAADA